MSDEDRECPPAKKQKTDSNEDPEHGQISKEPDFTEDLVEERNVGFTMEESKYGDSVNPDEVEKLKEFRVLDEVKSNEEDSDEEESDSSDGKSEGVPEEEIEKMLEEDLPEDFKGAPKPKEKPYHTRQKIVLEEKGINYFEVLPLDWMMVRHFSGMPVYMHRATRVCTLSKPYFLGKGNTRRHDIPISAIPCLNYRKALEEEAKQQEIDRRIAEQIKDGTWRNNDQDNSVNNKQKTDQSNEIDDQTKEINDRSSLEKSSQPNEDSSQSKEYENEVNNLKSQTKEGSDLDNKIQDNPQEYETGKCPIMHAEAKESENNVASEVNVENSQAFSSAVTNGDDVAGLDQVSGVAVSGAAGAYARPVVLPGGLVMPPPRVETVNTSWKTQHLTHDELNRYCSRLFHFKTVNIMHFKRWADRRKYAKARKTLQYPTLPHGTKLITIPAAQQAAGGGAGGGAAGGAAAAGGAGGGKASKRDWVMNMNGRSYLSVFHEYVRRALQNQPVYEFKQLENAATPYQATVHIGGMQYGVGRGTSKRLAKANAARASIQILIPEMKDDEREGGGAGGAGGATGEPDFSFFDYVGIEDPRITEFCVATCEPSPHAILRTCLLRNFGAGDRHIHTEMKKLEYQKIELTMKVGKHAATVVCKNKKTAKQRASQAILQALHPHVQSWGSLLRLYGSRSVKSCKEKKAEEQQITLLQDKARRNEPNYAVLEKLRVEMTRLRQRDQAVVPIGTLLLPHDTTLPTHSGSNLNNVDL